MKTKSFLLFSTSVFAISLFLIIFHSQPPQSFQSIVTQTHQHIKDFQVSLIQEQLHDEEQQNLVQEEKYLQLVGLEGHTELWHNTTVPVIVTHGRNDDHAPIVAFVRDAAKLPYTILVYNLGLKPYSLAVVSNYCNSSKCAIIDFDLESFPSHVSDGSTTAYRPLIIQHALSRVGGVIYCESDQRWTGTAAELGALWGRVAGGGGGGGGGLGALGVAAWARRAAVTSLTHPRMFRYLRARADDFLFVQMLDASRVLAAARAPAAPLLRRWVQCALTLNCLVPIGAQTAAAACRFDKKPQYRYSGCHGQDASALSILLAARAAFDEAAYEPPGEPWRRVPPAAARAALAAPPAPPAPPAPRNATDAGPPGDAPPAPL